MIAHIYPYLYFIRSSFRYIINCKMVSRPSLSDIQSLFSPIFGRMVVPRLYMVIRSNYYGKHVEDRRAEIWFSEVRSASHYHISPLTSDYPISVSLMQYCGLPINVRLRFILTWYLLVTDEFRKHAWDLDFNCATVAHQIPFVSANMGGRFTVRIMHHQRLSTNMMPSLLHMCKVETGQEHEVELPCV